MVMPRPPSFDTPHQGGSPVSGFSSMFSQLLKLFPRTEFQALVTRTHAERHARGFTCWGQFVAMLFCQLGRAHSLREICGGLRSSEGKLEHLGITAPSRSTLAYANEHRPWQLYRAVFEALLLHCQPLAKGRKKFRFKNKLVSLDSTVIDLCATLFDWAHFRRTKGAVKLHCVFDPEKAETLVFLTNHLAFGATTIAAIYKDRWQIELFFKALKQNLKIKTFVGTSPNALKVQVWTALIAMLILKYLQLKARFAWSLSNLVALLRMNLFTHRDLWAWLDHPFEGPPTILVASQGELALG